MSNGINHVFKKFSPYPLIVNFQNGKLKEGEHDIEGGLYSNVDKNNKCTAVIALNNMLYIGEEKQEENYYNLIVTRNKITGDIRLIEVGNVFVKALSDVEQKQLEENNKAKDEPDNRYYQLGEAFGSKRRKRILEQSKKLKVDIDSMKEQLEKTVNEKQLDVSEVSQLNVEPELQTEEYAPPCNRNAEDVKDVYNIEDLITQEQIDALQETANNVLETEKFEEYIEVSEYMKNRIVSLKASSSADKLTTCCLYLYTDCIIRYLSDPYRKVTSAKYVVCTYSESIDKVVLDNFSVFTDKGRARPQNLKDKAVCYTIVLLLLSSNYAIGDAMAFSKAISTPVTRLSQMCKVVGAHYVGDSKAASIVLKLPLVLPPVMKKKRLMK